jgi:hypothetical protein
MDSLNEFDRQMSDAPAAQAAGHAAAKKPAVTAMLKSRGFKLTLRIGYAVIYLISLLSAWLYNKSLPSDADLINRANIMIQESQTDIARQQREAMRQSFGGPVVLPQRQERVSAVDLLRQSAGADSRLGASQPAQPRQQEQLDYAAQVADYQARLKEQEDARKAKEAEEAKKFAEQEALARQQQAVVVVPKPPAPKPQLQTARRAGGGTTGGTFGAGAGAGTGSIIGGAGKAADFRPKQASGQQR